MEYFQKSTTIIIVLTLFFMSSPTAFAASDSVDVNLQVTGVCNYNGICEPELGENWENCPSDCPVPGARGGDDRVAPIISDLVISEITLNSATISWETNEPALCKLFWGRTYEYKEETISEVGFKKKHLTKLVGLSPATTYHFKIVCKDSSHNERETRDQKFTTLAPPDITPPANVSNFEAIPADRQITLTWQNPPDLDFKGVRIMRSEKFYPASPWGGTFIYDGKGTSFVDSGLTNGVRYYYTAFAYDRAGNFSSGAIASAVPQLVPLKEIFGCTDPSALNYNPEATIDDGSCEFPPPPPEVEKLTLEDFDFIQEDKKIPLIEEKTIKVKIEKPLINSIDYKKVPEVLKTIMVTLEKGNKFFSFLLRVNKEKTVYQATLFPPQEAGIYPLTISVLDYKNQTLKKIKGQLIVEGKPKILLKAPWYKKPCWKWIPYILLLILLMIVARYLWKKSRNHAKQNESAQIYGRINTNHE